VGHACGDCDDITGPYAQLLPGWATEKHPDLARRDAEYLVGTAVKMVKVEDPVSLSPDQPWVGGQRASIDQDWQARIGLLSIAL
jgi:hypothetical protein